MTFEGGCYCRKVRYVAEGNRGSRRNAIVANASTSAAAGPNMFMLMDAREVSLREGDAQDVRPQRSRSAGDARILRELRHPPNHPAAGPASGDPEGRNPR